MLTMLCVHCESQTESEDRCDECGQPPLVDGRYAIEEVLGRGANATTYRAAHVETGDVVALKELLVRNADSLKTLELFEREAGILQQLDHSSIPAYVEDFTVDLGPNVGMYIAQEYVDGTGVDDLVDEGPLPAREVFRIVRSVAQTLRYLQQLSPPVVHRDIKPGNLIERPNRSIALIDFGAVADVLGNSENGVPTMAGTLGYMAPEQLQGRTESTTDVYGLAATAVTLLTGTVPSVADDAWAEGLPDDQRMLLKKMLMVSPTNRPRPDEIVSVLDDFNAVFDAHEEALVRHEAKLARLQQTPRAIPHNFDHQPMEDGIIPLAIVILAMFVSGGFGMIVGPVGMAVTMAIGVGTAVITWWVGRDARERKKLFRRGVATIGRADGFKSSFDQPGVEVYFTFEIAGERFRGKSMMLDVQTVDGNEGDDVLLFYDPEDPTRNEIMAHYIYGMETLS